MLNAGFQYLEQRDANDTITKDGVVGKNSPFATSDNSGIYDIIAENLRWLKENVDDVKDTSDLEAIKQSVTDMYNEMKNNSSFGATAAKAQAEEAKKQAQAALESATNAKTYRDDVVTKSTEANDTLAEIKSCIDKAEKLNASNKKLEQFIADYATVASNKANEASTSATNAATSETNAKTSETAAKASETASKMSETNAKQYEAEAKAHMDALATGVSNAKASETASKLSETNAKTSEINAKASEVSAKTYETNASNSADLAKKWAESSDSPDSVNDTDSTTGKTQSSKSWALYARDRAISAYSSESNAKASETASKTSETNAKTSETNAAKSASNAKTSESAARTSETNAKASETAAKTSEDNASTSKSNAAASESNAKSYMDTAKEYMQKAQEALAAAQAIQSIVDTAKANAEKCLADVEAVKESLAKMITYQGSVDNYSDLPTNPQVGYSYNVKNADKEHGVNAGDNVVWNGEDWDNFGGAIDMSLFAELGKDVKFNTVTATTFTGNLDGTATKATNDKNGADIAATYLKKAGDTAMGKITFNSTDLNALPEVKKTSDDNMSGVRFSSKSKFLGAVGKRLSDGEDLLNLRSNNTTTDVVLDSRNYGSYALPKSGGTMSGALNFANGTWNIVGDDSYMGDHNISGTFCVKGANGETGIALFNKANDADYARISYDGGNINFNKTIGGNISGNADSATSATTASNVSGKIYYSADSPSVATDKLFTVKEAHRGDDNVPNNGLVIQTGLGGTAYNGKLYITDNGNDGVWIGGIAKGKEVGWTRLVENKGSWNINSATATNADTVDGYHASDLLKKIAAANTVGIVAASLTENGYAKFANGLILQWGNASGDDEGGNSNSTFPIAFPSTCFVVLVTQTRYKSGAALFNKSNTGFTWSARGGQISWAALGI
nr:MAG TPA: L SHAPED TAIL FIBER PROTEIN [Caudoviricetes sp.]